MGWTDEFRGKFGIRANADIPRDAKVAPPQTADRCEALDHRTDFVFRTHDYVHVDDRLRGQPGNGCRADMFDAYRGITEHWPHTGADRFEPHGPVRVVVADDYLARHLWVPFLNTEQN